MRVFAHENVFGESRIGWTCCAPLTSYLLTQAKIWVLDCTFNEIKDSKETFYLMNIVFFNDTIDRCKSPPFSKLTSIRFIFCKRPWSTHSP